MCSVTKVALIINEQHFYYAFEAYNPQCIWSHFCGISLFTKNMCYTLGLSTCRLSFQFSTPVLHKSWDRKLNVCLGSIDFFFGQFNFVSLSNSIELNLWTEFDWVWLRLIEIYFDWVQFTMPGVLHDSGTAAILIQHHASVAWNKIHQLY